MPNKPPKPEDITADPTPGKLEFMENGEANSYAVLTTEGRWLLNLLHNGEATLASQRANMRRLVACWNACELLSTEQVEAIDGLMPATLAYQVMQRQREMLLECLEYSLRWHDQLDMTDVELVRKTVDAVKAGRWSIEP